ncbi:XerC Integrase, partial [uncultured Caudovirales phage]
HTYQIYPPSGTNSWRVMRMEPGQPSRTVKDDAIDAVKKQYKAGTLTKDQARTQLDLVIERLYKADGVKVSRVESNGENEKLVSKYVQEVIRRKRKTSEGSKEAAELYIRRAVLALGETSLLSASKDELQDALDKRYPDQRQRRLVTALNSLLKWAKREVALERHAYIPPQVKHIPYAKLKPVLDRLPEQWAVAAELAHLTGLRIGEIMALEPQHKKRWGIFVEWQIDKDEKRKLPKNEKRRNVAVFDRALELYGRWMQLKRLIPHEERLRASRIIRSACVRAYPNRREWHLRFHDLRHSYAVACLEKGMSLDWLAMQLGNSVEVCREHYVGFVQTSAMEQAAYALLNDSKRAA